MFSPSESLDSDSEVVSSSHELLNSSSSRTSLAAFPRAWLRTRSVKSALFPLILRPCCFKYIFSWLFVSTSTSFSFFQEILDGLLKSVLFSYCFSRLCIQGLNVLYITFAYSLVHVVLGTELLQRISFRGGQFSLVVQFLYLDTRERFVDLVSSGRCCCKR